MKNTLTRVGGPYLFEFENESGIKCLLDANPKIGGSNMGFRPMELLGGALAGCVSIDLISILNKQRVDPSHFKIRIVAQRSGGTPSPFEKIELFIEVNKEIDKLKLERNTKLVVDRYCSVAASLDKSIEITYQIICL